MNRLVPADIRIALCETNPPLRTAFGNALYKMKLRNVELCKDAGSLMAYLNKEMVDLVICSTDLPGLNFAETVQMIRGGHLGRNPFVLFLATVHEATAREIRQIIEAGVDRVVRKPLSVGDMISYIESLSRKRRPFVATRFYFGPSRRAAPRRAGPMAVIEVPDTLQIKLSLGSDAVQLEVMIHETMAALRAQRALNGCFNLSRATETLAERLAAEDEKLDLVQEGRLLGELCREVQHFYAKAGHEHIVELADSLAALVGALTRRSNPTSLIIALQLMQQIADLLRKAAEIGPKLVPTIHEIAERIHVLAAKAA